MAEWGKIVGDWIMRGIRVILALAIGTSPAIGNKLQAVPFIWPPVGTLTLRGGHGSGGSRIIWIATLHHQDQENI
jgi:hypothetical protein